MLKELNADDLADNGQWLSAFWKGELSNFRKLILTVLNKIMHWQQIIEYILAVIEQKSTKHTNHNTLLLSKPCSKTKCNAHGHCFIIVDRFPAEVSLPAVFPVQQIQPNTGP